MGNVPDPRVCVNGQDESETGSLAIGGIPRACAWGSDQDMVRFLAFFLAVGLLVFIVRVLALIGRIRDRGLVLVLTIRGPNFRPPEEMAAWAAARRAIDRRNGLQET